MVSLVKSHCVEIGTEEQRIVHLHKPQLYTAKELTHPQTKSLPWIHTCKTGQPNSFGYESKGPIGASQRGSYKHDSLGL